jgi:hypothetical protein
VVGYESGFSNISGNFIINDTELITIFSFSETVSGVAFNFVSIEGSSTFTAFLGDDEIESFTTVAGYDGDFYGFEDIEFDSIRINSEVYALDNLQVATVTQVPEPESYAMFMAGLALMGFIARRRKNGLKWTHESRQKCP